MKFKCEACTRGRAHTLTGLARVDGGGMCVFGRVDKLHRGLSVIETLLSYPVRVAPLSSSRFFSDNLVCDLKFRGNNPNRCFFNFVVMHKKKPQGVHHAKKKPLGPSLRPQCPEGLEGPCVGLTRLSLSIIFRETFISYQN